MTTPARAAAASGPSEAADAELRATQAAVLTWWQGAGRDLPWRRTRDPWFILVSELMLQQTQVVRVVPVFKAFMDRFPTLAACAAAPVGEVVRHWAGLGYNRRALNLHRVATICVVHHGGRLPTTLQGLVAMPGIGPYTARAVLAFALERDVAVVDTNVARVVARLGGRGVEPAEAQASADRLLPPGRAWAWNQAMLDLGATICTRRSPRCHACPLSARCAWHSDGHPIPDPVGAGRRQSAFDGSDRQGRGRLIARLRHGPVAAEDLAAVMGWPADADRARRVSAALAADGLATVSPDGAYRLP